MKRSLTIGLAGVHDQPSPPVMTSKDPPALLMQRPRPQSRFQPQIDPLCHRVRERTGQCRGYGHRTRWWESEEALDARRAHGARLFHAADFPEQVRRTPGVRSVVQDMEVAVGPQGTRQMVVEPAAGGGTPTGATERFFPIQWALHGVTHNKLGRRGYSTVVFTLQSWMGGIWDQHVETAPRVRRRGLDIARSGGAVQTSTMTPASSGPAARMSPGS